MIKPKTGPFLANKIIISRENIRLKINKSLKKVERSRINKIIGLAERRISDAPAGRGFSEYR